MTGKRIILGQPSWILTSDEVEAAVTVRGGHMAPVTFFRASGRPVRPYYISPWQGRGVSTGEPVLDVLRGDFFCMPFGSDNRRAGEDHPTHGETAGSPWRLRGLEKRGRDAELRLCMDTKARPGRITKSISLVGGENVLYIEHELAGSSGPICLSHHATLAVPEEPGSLRLSASPLRLGRVAPRAALTNVGNEYYALAPGRRFSSLRKVPTIWKDDPWEDCGSLPHRSGFMDVIAIYPRQRRLPAWTAAAVPSQGYLWFALRDARVLPQTTLWMSNGGRHAKPWAGVNRCLGVEDGCAYFASGLAESARRNDLNAHGIPTVVRLHPRRTMTIRHIQGVARIPASFDRVKSVSFERDVLRFLSESGKTVKARVRWRFLEQGAAALTG